MIRDIIDWPLAMLRLTNVSFDIDWGGQGAGGDTGGGDQIVLNRFPRFVADVSLRFERDGIGQWRALRYRLQGRKNVVRLRMPDPPTMHSVGPALDSDWQGYLSGVYVEPRPTVRCIEAVAAGATSIRIDETAARAPVQLGAHLSYNDWPFAVIGRSGTGDDVTLQIAMLRTAIPLSGEIDLIPRGLFGLDDPRAGAPAFGRQIRIAPSLTLTEWITRT